MTDRLDGADARPIDRWITEHRSELVSMRRYLHAHPEVSGEEYETTQYLRERLTHLGLEPRVLADGTGLVCDLVVGDGGSAGIVALRADIDALPMDDEKDVPYRSVNPGVAHACGHDVHTTIVMGAGWALGAVLGDLGMDGRVRLIFQSAEERLPGGAQEIIAQGGLDDVSRIFGLHCDPTIEVGQVGLKSGAITSAADRLRITLRGPGGHTARPAETVDLVRAAAHVAIELPDQVRSALDTSDITLVFGHLHAGDIPNVIPTHAVLEGTLRTTDQAIWERAHAVVPRAVADVVGPTGAEHDLEYTRGVPAIVNNDSATSVVRRAATGLLGAEAVVPASQSFGADDFAWYLQQVPGTYFRLGTTTPGHHAAHDLHAGEFDVDEDCIAVGVSLLVATTLEALRG